MNKDIWFTGLNLNGLWNKKAIRGFWDEELKSWYDSTGNFDCWKPGLQIKKHIIVFASYDKKDIENFIKGVKSMATLNNNLNHSYFKK